jgi:uncharacterized protein
MNTPSDVLQQTRSVLWEMIQRINQVTPASRIILFGSLARGEATADSDLDFLVIVQAPVHRRFLAQAIYRNLHGIRLPVDIVVVTEEDVRQFGRRKGSILSTALEEGIIVYEREA